MEKKKIKGRHIDRICRLEKQVKDLTDRNQFLNSTCDSYARIIEEKDSIITDLKDTFDEQKAVLDTAIREANEQKDAYENALLEINSLKKEYERRIHLFIKKMKIQGDEF